MKHQFTSLCWSEIGWKRKQTKESSESIYRSFLIYWRRHTTVRGQTSLLFRVIFRFYWMSCLMHWTEQPRDTEQDRERTDIQIISWSLLRWTLSFVWMKAMITGLWAPFLLHLLLLTSLISLSPVCIFSLSCKTILCLHHSYICHWQTKGIGRRLLILHLFLSLRFPLKSTFFFFIPEKNFHPKSGVIFPKILSWPNNSYYIM